ncbi:MULTISPECIES: sugar ABC transporter ATP-binding protein [unclassified Mesorhizobium]|uniref:sugar ABC transporter ATP-binding protein n=1 Tax=unclassified Mesorhizobium TaxID=325217 RepID=UPI000FDBDD9D|nr:MULTISPECIES: sugar ABC transporter ATP-binding protein [unclassified Mesorhizobium]TGR23030.1 sugar ABC transporter ATP-binding protein [Mesorhizobium sp. M8A.F.Ca.ET.197.01.1.1]TGR39117.1 sugar ABC transporter ATP-binding protein [bacterium M00.F.Ca.ET.199.01.1.1]TGR46710.1 sugar ABC transporter ATP-binding protein [Mesorhizobium sp. M8A.F.Ca.ET.198.01.1.1]TGV85216.1 sugar ABC transporter ATP-binding protein [Mesorhizobium sp. M00.F.Ca.ET.149.01.1.1]
MVPALELRDVSKSWGPVKALKSVSLTLKRHAVLGLVGENGAGKSTLISIINGTVRPSTGSVRVNGKEVNVGHPSEAGRLGIATVFQEQGLIPNLPVYENILLGREAEFARAGILSASKMIALTREVLKELELDIDPLAITGELTFGSRQLVEIAKAFAVGKVWPVEPIILLDEPTSALSESETQLLFNSIRRWRGKASIIFVSHHLKDVFAVCDEVVALKDGEVSGNWPITNATPDILHEAIVGRVRSAGYYKESEQREVLGEVVLSVRNLNVAGQLKNFSLDIREGEIVGIAGVLGSGKATLGQVITGSVRADEGEVRVNGKVLRPGSRIAALRADVGLVPSERNKAGLIGMHSLEWNITLPSLSRLKVPGTPMLSVTRQAEVSDTWIKRLRVRVRDRHAQIRSMSGGNAQKVVFAKWLARGVKVFVLDDPGRGLDVGAKEEVYTLLRQLANEGVAILLISDNLPEVIGLSNRVITLRGGQVTSEITAAAEAKPRETTVVSGMV